MGENGHEWLFLRFRSQGANGQWIAHPDLRSRLVESAGERGSSLTEVIVEIASGIYGVPFERSGRRTAPSADVTELNLRLPSELAGKLAGAASQRSPRWSIQTELLTALCSHYGLAMPARVPRMRRRAAAA